MFRVTYFREHWCCLRTTELRRQTEVNWHRILCQTESFSVSFDIFPQFSNFAGFPVHYLDTHQPPISGICLFFWTITNGASSQSCTQLMTPIRTDVTVLGSSGCVDSCRSCQQLYCLLMKVSSYSVRACLGSVILVQLTMSFVATNYECARNHIVDDGCFNVVFAYLKEPRLEMWSVCRHYVCGCWCSPGRVLYAGSDDVRIKVDMFAIQ